MKKTLCSLLAMVLTFSMCLGVFAEEPAIADEDAIEIIAEEPVVGEENIIFTEDDIFMEKVEESAVMQDAANSYASSYEDITTWYDPWYAGEWFAWDDKWIANPSWPYGYHSHGPGEYVQAYTTYNYQIYVPRQSSFGLYLEANDTYGPYGPNTSAGYAYISAWDGSYNFNANIPNSAGGTVVDLVNDSDSPRYYDISVQVWVYGRGSYLYLGGYLNPIPQAVGKETKSLSFTDSYDRQWYSYTATTSETLNISSTGSTLFNLYKESTGAIATNQISYDVTLAAGEKVYAKAYGNGLIIFGNVVMPTVDVFVRQDAGINAQNPLNTSALHTYTVQAKNNDLIIGTNGPSLTGAYRESFLKFDLTPAQITAIKNGSTTNKTILKLFVDSVNTGIMGDNSTRAIEAYLVPANKVNNVTLNMTYADAYNAGITARDFLRYSGTAAVSQTIYTNTVLNKYIELDLTSALKTYFNNNTSATSFAITLTDLRPAGLLIARSSRAGTTTAPQLIVPEQ